MQTYPGKDGGLYNSIFEQKAADTKYNQMERLIESQRIKNNNSNRIYLLSTNLSCLSILGFLLSLIALVYPYLLSVAIFAYCDFFPMIIKIVLFIIVWITYFPVLINLTKIIK